MPVYIEPTEASSATRLSSSFLESSTILPALERYTGADFLITPYSHKLTEITDALPHQMYLENAVEFGVLVQRKSGGDFVNSLPHLKEIQCRMLEWAKCGACWLLVTGLTFGKSGLVIVDGTASRATFSQVRGAMRHWQLRGGNVEVLQSDEQIGPWCAEMLDYLRSIEANPERKMVHKPPLQSLSMEDSNWVTTGSAFPQNIGRHRRNALHEELQARGVESTLANAMCLLTSDRLEVVAGWGTKTARDVREWWGASGVVRDTPRFGSITIFWKDGLPIEASGDGVEMKEENGGVSVTFTNYNSLVAFRDVLCVTKEAG